MTQRCGNGNICMFKIANIHLGMFRRIEYIIIYKTRFSISHVQITHSLWNGKVKT